MHTHQDRLGAVGLILTGVTSLQFGAALAATVFPLIGPVPTVALRLVTSAGALIVAGRGVHLPDRRAGGLRAPLLLGAVLAGMNSCVYLAIARLPLGEVITIEFLGPLAVALAHSRHRRDVALALAAAAGVVLLTGGVSGGSDPIGVTLAMIAAAGWALYILLNRELGRRNRELGRRGADGGLALASVVAAGLVAPVTLAQVGTAMLRPGVLAIGLAIGLLSSALPYTLDQLALRRIGPGSFGVLMSVHPAVAALAGLLVLGQRLTWPQLVGMALVVAASAAAARRSVSPSG
jgi:inner membrane transporter RhtA